MARHEFKAAEVEDLLIRCHRRCCVCHRFCGVKMEVDHIRQAADEGAGNIDNAIPLCFECHAEVHHYNPEHPKGKRFSESELKGHRDQWLAICREHPEMFVHSQPSPEAGSLERLGSELVVNIRVSALLEERRSMRGGARFEVSQFRRIIADGTLLWLSSDLRQAIEGAYIAALDVNGVLDRLDHGTREAADAANLREAVKATRTKLAQARALLQESLSSDSP